MERNQSGIYDEPTVSFNINFDTTESDFYIDIIIFHEQVSAYG